jgi:hypothetical protein
MLNENKTSGTLILDSKVFSKLHQELINQFGEKYEINPDFIIDYQLYGFNNYDENSPSIKKMVDQENNLYLNGKYLYNKWRQYKNGGDFIKISREFSFAYFHCLGYRDIYDFLNRSELLSDKDKSNQYSIIGKKNVSNNQEFYIGYYLGEEGSIIKSKFTIYPETKEVDFIIFDWEDKEQAWFEYFGTIVELKNIITVFFKKENSKTERDAYISIYYGNENVIFKPYLKGIYGGYDKYDQPVSGEIIFQRVSNEIEQESIIRSLDEISPFIENYLFNKRFIIDHNVPQTIAEISQYGKFIKNLEKISEPMFGLIQSIDGGLNFIEINILTNGKLTITIDKQTDFSGYLQIDNKDSVFIGRLINSNSDSKISFSICTNFENKIFITGTIMGYYQTNEISCGKFYAMKPTSQIVKEDFETELQHFQNGDKTFIYSDIFKKTISILDVANIRGSNKYNTSFLLNEPQSSESNLTLKKIIGEYYLIYSEGDFTKINTISIDKNAITSMKSDQLVHSGDALIFSSGLLTLNYTSRNNLPYYSQILLFIGKHTIETASYFSGVANFLDNDLKPASYNVFLIPKHKFLYVPDEISINPPNHQLLLNDLNKIGLSFNLKKISIN